MGGRTVAGVVLVIALVAACGGRVGDPASVVPHPAAGEEASAVVTETAPPTAEPIPDDVPRLDASAVSTSVVVEPPVESAVSTSVVVEPPVESAVSTSVVVEPPVESAVSTSVVVEPLVESVVVEPPVESVAPASPTEGAAAGPVSSPKPATSQPTERRVTPPGQPVAVLVAKDGVNGVIPVYDTPDGTRLSFRDGDLWSFTYRGNRLVLRVTQGAEGDEWVEADLPVRPTGVRGWIRTENFDWTTVNHHILVDLSDRSVALFEGNELIVATQAIVGTPSTPTPILSGFIVEKIPNHSQQNASIVLGDWILMLSFFSQTLDSFGGGLPRIALHGTHIPGRVGEALSNGCIRIPNDIIETIAHRAPLGTVVNVRA